MNEVSAAREPNSQGPILPGKAQRPPIGRLPPVVISGRQVRASATVVLGLAGALALTRTMESLLVQGRPSTRRCWRWPARWSRESVW